MRVLGRDACVRLSFLQVSSGSIGQGGEGAVPERRACRRFRLRRRKFQSPGEGLGRARRGAPREKAWPNARGRPIPCSRGGQPRATRCRLGHFPRHATPPAEERAHETKSIFETRQNQRNPKENREKGESCLPRCRRFWVSPRVLHRAALSPSLRGLTGCSGGHVHPLGLKQG